MQLCMVLQDSSFEEVDRFLETVEKNGQHVQSSIGHGAHTRDQSASLEARVLKQVMLSLQAF